MCGLVEVVAPRIYKRLYLLAGSEPCAIVGEHGLFSTIVHTKRPWAQVSTLFRDKETSTIPCILINRGPLGYTFTNESF